MSLLSGLQVCIEWRDVVSAANMAVPDLSGNAAYAYWGVVTPAVYPTPVFGPGVVQGVSLISGGSGPTPRIGVNYARNGFVEFTIAAWFYGIVSTGQSYERIVDKSYNTGFYIGRQATTPNSFGGGILEAVSPFGTFITLPDGAWNHLVMRRRYVPMIGASKDVIGNGGAVTALNISVSATALDTTQMCIGDVIGGGASWNGYIGQVCFWDRAITDDEVSQVYNGGRGLPYPFGIRRMGRPLGSRVIVP